MARHRRRHRRRRYGAFITMPGFTGIGSSVSGAMRTVKSNLPMIVGGGLGVVTGTVLFKWLLSVTGLGAKVPVALARFYPLLGGLAGGVALSFAGKALKKPAWGHAAMVGSVIAGGATVLIGYLWDVGPLRKFADFVTIPTMGGYGYDGVIVDNYITHNPGFTDYSGVIVDNVNQQQQLAELSAMAMGDLGNEDMMERLAP